MTNPIARSIVNWINNELPLDLRLDRVIENSHSLLCRNPKGKRFVIVCYSPVSGTTIMRSLLRVVRPDKPCTWSVNGQAGKNTQEIAYWGENHRYLWTADQWAENKIESGYDLAKVVSVIEAGAFILPRHLSREAVLQAFQKILNQTNP